MATLRLMVFILLICCMSPYVFCADLNSTNTASTAEVSSTSALVTSCQMVYGTHSSQSPQIIGTNLNLTDSFEALSINIRYKQSPTHSFFWTYRIFGVAKQYH